MTKTKAARLLLWFNLACSAFELYVFEIGKKDEQKAKKKNAQSKCSEHLTLTEINQRLSKIEQQLIKLIPPE
ncbi:hypothetical protein SDC9_108423 [bioreactor metagenome]|uniref:Uncharacterized protein n=1 Tax=bioreactor metagenome TaxID=1076179 RepID=A0A645BEF4_9ZZZZ